MTAVLVTGMGSTTAISVTKGLRKQSEVAVQIVGTDVVNGSEIAGSSFCNQFYTVPSATNKQYIAELLRICEAETVQVLFPIIDIELETIAAHIEAFSSRDIYVWLPSLETVQICNDKYQTHRFFVRNDIPTPQTWLPEEVVGQEEELPYPLIVKPRNGISSRDVFRVSSANELSEVLEKVKRPIVQEYLEGREFTVDVVADEDSRLLAVVPRERIEVRAGISYKGRTVRDEQLINDAGQIARAMKVKGPCNIQCRVRNGKPIYFEVNPRFSGTLPLTIAAGVNSPLLLLKLALGEKLDQHYYDFKESVYMTRYWEEVFSL
jgi:carbamoyl-phosphate synthase large subunit